MESQEAMYVVKTSGNTKLKPKHLNIDGSDDMFYRYKMRQLYAQVVGQGKMIKTLLLNVDDVAKDMKVPPSYLTAYIGYELNAQYKYDSKKPEREKASISGSRDAKDLSKVVSKFIQEIVLCPVCKLPETTMIIEKKANSITLSCRSCGSKSPLSLREKFRQYVYNNSKLVTTTKEEHAVKKKHEEATKEADKKINGQMNGNGQEKKDRKTRKSKKKQVEEEDDDDDVEWSCSTSADAVKQRRMEMLPDTINHIISEAKTDPISSLKQFYESNPKGDIASEVERLQKEFEFSNSKRAGLLFEVLFDSTDFPNFTPHIPVLHKVICDEKAQFGLLDCVSKLFSKDSANLKHAIPTIKLFYDEDILPEDTILKWNHKKLKNQALKDQIKPFINWLETAEEEDDDDEDEE